MRTHPLLSDLGRLDVAETPERHVILLDVPGVRPGDLHVETEGETVVVRGRRDGRGDRPAESFERRIRFDEVLDPDTVTADLHLGVLRVDVAVRPAHRRTIPITAPTRTSRPHVRWPRRTPHGREHGTTGRRDLLGRLRPRARRRVTA